MLWMLEFPILHVSSFSASGNRKETPLFHLYFRNSSTQKIRTKVLKKRVKPDQNERRWSKCFAVSRWCDECNENKLKISYIKWMEAVVNVLWFSCSFINHSQVKWKWLLSQSNRLKVVALGSEDISLSNGLYFVCEVRFFVCIVHCYSLAFLFSLNFTFCELTAHRG